MSARRRFNLSSFLDILEHSVLRIVVTLIGVSWLLRHLWTDLVATWPSLPALLSLK